MKVYVLTICNNEGSWEPSVYTNKKLAQQKSLELYKETKENYRECIEDSQEIFILDDRIDDYYNWYITLPDDLIQGAIYECELEGE